MTDTPQFKDSGIQGRIMPCCVLTSPLESQHLPTVTLQVYAQMFPVFRMGNKHGFSGTTVWS